MLRRTFSLLALVGLRGNLRIHCWLLYAYARLPRAPPTAAARFLMADALFAEEAPPKWPTA
jgi:hypothetical protein